VVQVFKPIGLSYEAACIGKGSGPADRNFGDTAASHPWRSGVRQGISCGAEVVRTAAARWEPRSCGRHIDFAPAEVARFGPPRLDRSLALPM
jgi:hypothetical protein